MSKKEKKAFHWIRFPALQGECSEDFVALLERAWNDGSFRFALVTHPTTTLENEAYNISEEELEKVRRFAMDVRQFANERLRELTDVRGASIGPEPDPWFNCGKMESLK